MQTSSLDERTHKDLCIQQIPVKASTQANGLSNSSVQPDEPTHEELCINKFLSRRAHRPTDCQVQVCSCHYSTTRTHDDLSIQHSCQGLYTGQRTIKHEHVRSLLTKHTYGNPCMQRIPGKASTHASGLSSSSAAKRPSRPTRGLLNCLFHLTLRSD